MKWSNLKINKCPQCNKDFLRGLREENKGAFGLKLLFHPCGFKIYERKYREIVSSMVNKEIEKEDSEAVEAMLEDNL